MTLDNEQIARKAYQIAEDKDLEGWVAAFTEDGTFTDDKENVTCHHLAKETSSASSGTSGPCSGRRTGTRCWLPLTCSITRMSSTTPTPSSAPCAAGQMPCDGAWPAEQLDKLQQWIDMGKPA